MVQRDDDDANNLHFFKPLLPGFSKQLAIPTAFVKQHILKERCCKETATLVSPNGGSWCVDVYKEKIQENMYFVGDGWLEFVIAHNLGLGYFLVFCYRGNMTFNFRAYDLTACEITSYASIDAHKGDVNKDEKITHIEEKKKKKITKVKVEDEEKFEHDDKDEENKSVDKRKKKKTLEVKIEDQEEFDEFTPKKKRKVSEDKIENHEDIDKSTDKKLKQDSNCKRRTNSRYHERVKRNNCSNRKGKAHFEATIWPCNLSQPYMNIPCEFSDANGLTEHRGLTLMDPKGRSWHVRLFHRRIRFGNSRNTSSMVAGWQKFVVANKLKLGDKCIFELASEGKNRKVVMKVQIMKKAV